MDIRQFFSNLRIRAKLLLAFGSVLLLSLVLAALSFRTIDRVSQYKGLNEKTDALLIYLQSLEIAMDEFIYEEFKSKEFLEGGQPRSLESFVANYSNAQEKIKEIQHIPWLTQPKSIKQVNLIQSEMKELQISFSNLTTKLKERGFKDFGFEGALRKSIHQVEKADFKYDKAELLTLRRHEKDFFLRKDVKYQAEFNKTIAEFRLKATKTAQPEVVKLIDNYQSGFNAIVETETAIGLAEDKGLRGEVRGRILAIRPLIADFSTQMDQESSIKTNQSITFLAAIVIMQFLFGLSLAIFYSSQLSKPVKEIRTAVQSLAAGKYPKKMIVDSTEEMGQTKEGFNQFIDRLQTATAFAESMGKGDLQIQYDENFREDVLAKSLITMQQKLREAEEQKSKTNWVNEGGAKFNDILKKEDVPLEVLGDEVLRFLITYIGANQGALYIKDGEEMLTRISTYAYGKRKFVDQQIAVGSGLVGQCVMEAHTIFIKEVPPEYVSITSGLGQATPRAVLIVPLKVRDAVMGVLEMASFESFETFQIQFVEKISENIATLLSNRKGSELTKRLLQESEERSEMLTQQEEEMRQNTEELQATQEEMIRQRNELEKEIAILRQRLSGKIVFEQ